MLDECIAPKSARLFVQSLALHKPSITAFFLQDWIKLNNQNQTDNSLPLQGAWDVDWTKTIVSSDWCVISCDCGKGREARTKRPPLQLILPTRKITGFFMSGSIANLSGFEKIRACYYVFPELLEQVENSPAGTRFKIKRQSSGGYGIHDWPLKPNESLPELYPTNLPPLS